MPVPKMRLASNSQDNATVTNEIQSSPLKIEPSKSKSKPKIGGKSGYASLINSKNGKRLSLSLKVIEALRNCKSVQVGFHEYKIALSERLGEDYDNWPLKENKNKRIVYSNDLVNEITERFNLDYSDRSSITFHEMEVDEEGEYPIVLIKIIDAPQE